jgi:hypothetical protein
VGRSRGAMPPRGGAQPYRATFGRMRSRRATPVARERNPTTPLTQECFPDALTPVARERNPTTAHTQECVPDVQRRSRGSATLYRAACARMRSRRATPVTGSATLPRRIPKNVFQTCNGGRAGAQPYRVTCARMYSRGATAVGAGAQPYHAAYPRMRSNVERRR